MSRFEGIGAQKHARGSIRVDPRRFRAHPRQSSLSLLFFHGALDRPCQAVL